MTVASIVRKAMVDVQEAFISFQKDITVQHHPFEIRLEMFAQMNEPKQIMDGRVEFERCSDFWSPGGQHPS